MKKLLLAISCLATLQTNAQITDTTLAKKNALHKVEKEAEFEGGQNALIKFLTKNLKYPKKMVENGFCGQSTIEFVVCADGGICDVKVIRSAGESFDNESMRVVKLLPKWSPGMQDGKAVPSYYSLPITFELESEMENSKDHYLFQETYATTFASYNGGDAKMRAFIDNNINITLPKKPICVILAFKIDKDGTANNIECISNCKEEYKQEALRILSLFPNWIPAKLDDQLIVAKMQLAIVFKK